MSTRSVNRLITTVVGIAFVVSLALSFEPTIESGGVDQRVSVAIKVKPTAVISASTIPAGTTVEQVKLRTTVRDLSAQQNLWLAGWRLPSLVLIFAILMLAIRFAHLVAQHQPFANGSIRNMRAVGALLVAAPFIRLFTDEARRKLVEHSNISGIALEPLAISYGPLVAGIAVLLASEAFAAGRRAEQEVEGLV